MRRTEEKIESEIENVYHDTKHDILYQEKITYIIKDGIKQRKESKMIISISLETINKMKGRNSTSGVTVADAIMTNLKDNVTENSCVIHSYKVKTDENNNERYVIECSPWYPYSIISYTSNTVLFLDEVKSQLIDLFNIYKTLHTGIWGDQIMFTLNANTFEDDYMLLMRKNYESPYPQIVINPVAFLLGFIEEYQNIDCYKSIVQLLQLLQSFYQNIKPINEDENVYEYLKQINKLLNDEMDEDGDICLDDIWSLECDIVNELEQFKTTPQFDFKQLITQESIGKGGHGFVFKCLYNYQPYALKIVHSSNEIKELKKEVFILNKCGCPFILKTVGMVETSFLQKDKELNELEDTLLENTTLKEKFKGKPKEFGYMIMDLCEMSLSKYMEKHKRLNIDMVKLIFGQIVYGMFYLYCEKRIVQRDLKTGNILVTVRNENFVEIKICDFGFARTYCDKMATTAGTPTEADPKIIKGETYDARADLYSLGCMLYYLKNGTKIYHDECKTKAQFIQMVKRQQFVPKDENSPDPDVQEINTLLKMLLSPISENNPLTWKMLRENEFVCKCMNLVVRNFRLNQDYTDGIYFGEVEEVEREKDNDDEESDERYTSSSDDDENDDYESSDESDESYSSSEEESDD